MDDSDELISHGHVGLGMYYCLKNTKRHFEDGKILYDCKKFQSAIPIFIICIEEAFKTMNWQQNLENLNQCQRSIGKTYKIIIIN